MEQQPNSWSCSVMSYRWVIQSTQIDPELTYDEALNLIGYPNCVNPTYGLMSAQCMIDAFAKLELPSLQKWVTFDEAYAICREHTGVINPIGMYHFMAIRGIDGSIGGSIWVANSAPGYAGVWDNLTREQFNNLSPVQLIYLV
jgi:hypothetical protein